MNGRFAHLNVACNVLNHHDRIIDHKACGNRERHEGQVVDRKIQQVHDPKGAHQRERHSNTWNEGRVCAPQKHKDHEHHQRNGDQQLDLNVRDRGSDGDGSVVHDLKIEGLRQIGFELRQECLQTVHGLDHVGTRLALDVDDDRVLLVGPGL